MSLWWGRVFGRNDLSYTELDGDGEEIQASGFSNGITTRNTVEVDEARLNQALLALDGL
jgi:hypothetical protein